MEDFMIDAANITKYDLSDFELEERILFWVLAAGKNGTRAADTTNNMIRFWQSFGMAIPPFDAIMHYDTLQLANFLKQNKTGCHNIKAKTLSQLARSGLDLRECSAEELENIYGIGMKTSRCFIIHSRKNAEYAGLDTHMLKHLKSLGYDVPKSTPTRKKYLTLESVVIKLATAAGKSPAEYDLDIWNKYKVV